MRPKPFTILVVEDDPNDQFLIATAFAENGVDQSIHFAADGKEAIAYLTGSGQYADRSRFPYPAFLVTDLKMPRADGFSVLEHLRSRPEYPIIPTLVLSSAKDPQEVTRSYRMGASAYVVKPFDYNELRSSLRLFYDFWSLCEVPEVDTTGRIQQGKPVSG